MIKRIYFLAMLFCMVIISCQDDSFNDNTGDVSLQTRTSGTDLDVAFLDEINAALATNGENYRIAKVELITMAESNEAGVTILASDVGNKQLAFDFVPDDARRGWSVTAGGVNSIDYAIDQVDAISNNGIPAAQTNAAIQAASQTWDNKICSDLGFSQVPDFGQDLGVVAFIFGLGGGPTVVADLMHAGWGDINFAGGVLAATFTFGFTDINGFTDVNNDGKLDCAFREIYYDPSWNWGIGVGADVESIALHEIGHGLSQAHFGTIKIKNDGTLQASPRAVMNALYSGVLTDLEGTDNGGHCSIWGNWPNN